MSNKQVLLIGDSIRLGYCQVVKDALQEQAEVIFPAENCRDTHYVLESLAGWRDLCHREDVAVVQFNCGHWDAEHFDGDETSLTPVEQYGENLRKIIKRLRRYFPQAQLIFATTTPMNPNPAMKHTRTTEEICGYNRMGMAVAEECGVAVNDLYAVAAPWESEMFADYCHFTEKGYEILGKTVADFIKNRMY